VGQRAADYRSPLTSAGGGPTAELAIKLESESGFNYTWQRPVPEKVSSADAVLKAIDEERFLILPHSGVLDVYRQKATDYERWLRGMRRYQRSLLDHES